MSGTAAFAGSATNSPTWFAFTITALQPAGCAGIATGASMRITIRMNGSAKGIFMKIERSTIYRCDRCGAESYDPTKIVKYSVPGRETDCEGRKVYPAIVSRDLCSKCFMLLCEVTEKYFAVFLDDPGGKFSKIATK